MKRTHTTLSGHVIEYEQTPEIDAFLSRLEALVTDPAMRENDLIDLAYSRENPILDRTVHATRGFVTRQVFANPTYHIISDLLFRKRVIQDRVDLDALAAAHSLSISETAAQLQIDEAAVLAMLEDHRLASWMKDGEPFINPSSLRAHRSSPSASDDQGGHVR